MVFTLRPSAHLRCLATLAGIGIIPSSSGIARFVQGGVVKTFRWASSPFAMRPRDLLHKLVSLAPAFKEQWESDRNCFRAEDGSYSLHSVCLGFSEFFRDHYATLDTDTVIELFDYIEWNLVEPGAVASLVDNALCTCFLENISSEPCGQFAIGFMGRKSRAFFDRWHVGPPY